VRGRREARGEGAHLEEIYRIHHRVFLSCEVSGVVCTAATAATYSDARECARKHIRGKGEVWRQGFIAGAQVSDGCFSDVVAQWSRTRVLLR
jgi:hypothetical protein